MLNLSGLLNRSSRPKTHFMRHVSKIIPRTVAFLAAILVLSNTCITTVAALSSTTLDFFNQNGIYYYNPDGSSSTCTTYSTGSNVTIIGDSITEGSKSAISERLPQATIYSQVSKTFGNADDSAESPNNTSGNPSGISIIKYLLAENQVQPTVVYALGTNNMPLSQAQIDALLNLLGNNYQIFFVTNYDSTGAKEGYYQTNNALFSQAAQNSNVHVIDWAASASANPSEYLSSDGIHPTAAGQDLFAELIDVAVGGSSSVTSGLNGNYTNYAGDAVLTGAQITLLESNIATYQQAIQETGTSSKGITWQLIAAIHYKETGLGRYNPSNGQGVYQMYSYVNATGESFSPAESISESEFLRQTKLVITEVIVPKLDSLGLTLRSDDEIKRFFFSYNGMSERYINRALAMGFSEEQANNGEGSTYVMNRYDAARDPSNLDTMDPNWYGGYVSDGVWSDTATSQTFGAFTVYAAIGGATVCVDGVFDGGLTLEQAEALMDDYINNVNCSDYDIYCAHGSSGGAKANCVTFVQYFIARFTTATGIGATGDGGWVVSNLTGTDVSTSLGTYAHTYDYSAKGFVYGGFSPQPFAIFSTGKGTSMCGSVKCGHTGVVLGIDAASDTIYIGQAGYDTPLVGYSDVVKKKLSDYTTGEYWFAYTDSIINTAAIAEVVGNR